MEYPYQYNVLFLDGNGTAKAESAIGIKLDGSESFAIDAWIRVEEIVSRKLILVKPGVFCMGIEGNRFFFRLGGYPTVLTSSDKGEVREKEWTHICAVYNRAGIFLYINGVPNLYAAVNGFCEDNGESFIIGDGMCGMIRQVRIFNCALDHEQVNKYMMATDLSDGGFKELLAAYFDFSRVPAAERLRNGKITLSKDRMQKSISQGAKFCNNAYITVDQEPSINPAGQGNDPYTVQGWVYLEPDGTAGRRYTVFANGDVNEWAGMSLYIEESKGKYYVKALRGTGTELDDILTSKAVIEAGRWTNIALTYSLDTMRLYINGVPDAVMDRLYPIPVNLAIPQPRIGAEVVENDPNGQDWFSGVISRIDIWEKELSEAEIRKYAGEVPDLDADRLLASYSFHLSDRVNACTGTVVGEHNGLEFEEVFQDASETMWQECSGVQVFEEEPLNEEQLAAFRKAALAGKESEGASFTVTSHVIDGNIYFVAHDRYTSYTICQAEAAEMDAMTRWYIELALIIAGGVLTILFGVKFNSSNQKLLKVLQNLCQNPRLKTLFASEIGIDTIVGFFKLLLSTGTVTELLRAMLTGFPWWQILWMIAKTCLLAAAAWVGGWVYYAAALGILVGELLVHMTRCPEKKVCKAGLSAVRFHVPGYGMTIPLRINNGEKVPVPEWTSNRRNNSHAAYLIRKANRPIVIQASFKSASMEMFTVQVRCVDKSGNKLFGNSQPVAVNMAGGRSCPDYVNFNFPNHQMARYGVGVESVRLQWEYKDESGIWKNLENTEHKIYRILEEPKLPWGTGDEQGPWVKALEYACTWADGASTREEIAEKIVEQVNGSLRLFYDMGNGHSFYTGNAGNTGLRVFYLSRFLNHLAKLEEKKRQGKANSISSTVNCTDCASICTTFANTLGCWLSEKIMRDTVRGWGFECNPILAIGQTVWKAPFENKQFSYHEVCMMEPLQDNGAMGYNNYRIYDACLKVNGSVTPGESQGRIEQLPEGMVFSKFEDGKTVQNIPKRESYREHLAANTDGGVTHCRYDTGINATIAYNYKGVE